MPGLLAFQELWEELSATAQPAGPITFRLTKTEKTYWGNNTALSSRYVPLKRRVHTFSTRVVSRLLLGAGGWTLYHPTLHLLRSWRELSSASPSRAPDPP